MRPLSTAFGNSPAMMIAVSISSPCAPFRDELHGFDSHLSSEAGWLEGDELLSWLKCQRPLLASRHKRIELDAEGSAAAYLKRILGIISSSCLAPEPHVGRSIENKLVFPYRVSGVMSGIRSTIAIPQYVFSKHCLGNAYAIHYYIGMQ